MSRKQSAPDPSEEHIRLIRRIGGPTKVASLVNDRLRLPRPLTPQAVSNWLRRGIPFRYRATLALAASELGFGVPAGFMGEAPAEPDQVPFL